MEWKFIPLLFYLITITTFDGDGKHLFWMWLEDFLIN